MAEKPPEPVKAASAKPELAKSESVKPAQARNDTPRVEHPRPPSPTVVIQNLIPAPPPLPQPQPPTPPHEADAAQSVLARLRQIVPAAPPPQQPVAPPGQQVDASAVAERPRRATAPSLPRLNAARSALANGQIEEARRLLQQAQLQLVFGSADTQGGDPAMAAKGAADVAHALDALSGSDIRLSRRYVDVAMGDLAGTPTEPPVQETMRRASGYAPAYPPR